MPASEKIIKETGVAFTSEGLAKFLTERIAHYTEGKVIESVLDPACGDGALLNAFAELYPNVNDISGFDTNEEYLKNAKLLMNVNHLGKDCKFIKCDFLEAAPDGLSLFPNSLFESKDVIIANPPYVRTQILGAEKAQKIARQFHLSGRVDLYYPFLIGMTNCLKVGGILGVITSNRYLTTKSGADIRHFLLDNYDILEVIDLGDTKLFDAAVLPAIFIGRKKRVKVLTVEPCSFGSIYEYMSEPKNVIIANRSSIFEILKDAIAGFYKVGNITYEYKSGIMKYSTNRDEVWRMTNEEENDWINTINNNAAFRVGDKFKVRVGIKSCADSVFLTDWLRESVILETEVMHPLISSENITQWHFDASSASKVLYPYKMDVEAKEVIDLEKYPKTKVYLLNHRDQLEGRKYLMKTNREWFEMWVPQKPYLWSKPKVVFPDISIEPRFCFDESGAIVNGNCYWMVAQTEADRSLLLLIEGICNSDLMVRYHDLCFNNKLYSGRRRYLSQYIEKYPIPDPNSKESAQIITIVEALNAATVDKNIKTLKTKLNRLVCSAFSI